MLPCFSPNRRLTEEEDSDHDREDEARRAAKRKSGAFSPKDTSSYEEPFSPGSRSSSAPLSPASPPPGKRMRTWDDGSIPIQQRVLLAVEDGDVTVLKELCTVEDRVLKLLAWTDSSDGDTFAHLLARCGNNDALMLLLGQTPLSEMHGTNVRRSAFLNATNQLQETPMLIALGSGNFSTASLLLLAGADPWLQNYNRESSFYMACYCGASELVTKILQSKTCSLPRVRAASGDGLTGLACARTRGHLDIVDAIQAYLDAEGRKKLKE
jgi:hypothetical protein